MAEYSPRTSLRLGFSQIADDGHIVSIWNFEELHRALGEVDSEGDESVEEVAEVIETISIASWFVDNTPRRLEEDLSTVDVHSSVERTYLTDGWAQRAEDERYGVSRTDYRGFWPVDILLRDNTSGIGEWVGVQGHETVVSGYPHEDIPELENCLMLGSFHPELPGLERADAVDTECEGLLSVDFEGDQSVRGRVKANDHMVLFSSIVLLSILVFEYQISPDDSFMLFMRLIHCYVEYCTQNQHGATLWCHRLAHH